MKKEKNIEYLDENVMRNVRAGSTGKISSQKINPFINLEMYNVHGGARENETQPAAPALESIGGENDVSSAISNEGDWSVICKRFTLGSCENSEPCCGEKKFFEKKPKSKKFKSNNSN